MRRILCLLLLTFATPAQDLGGRDPGKGAPSVVFVRWRRSQESKAIYDAAWRALEPFRALTRRRLVDFESDRDRARALLDKNKDVALVVALDRDAAGVVRELLPKTTVLEVSPGALAQVNTRVDRARLADLMRRFHPGVRTVRVHSPRIERLPRLAVGEKGQLAWVAEEGELERTAGMPVVSTSPYLPEGAASLVVRPDPRSVGLRVAALVIGKIRDGKEFERTGVRRLFVTVDLRAAKAAGYRVPLDMLARADAVRRSS